MGRIPMSSGWSIIPEGEYVFCITEATHDENFGKVEIKLITADGLTHSERFSILKADGSYNDGALGALSNIAKNALNDYDREDYDTDELVGRYIRGEITHSQVESTKYPGRMNTYAHLRNCTPADGFDTTPSAKVVSLLGLGDKAPAAPGLSALAGLEDLLK